MAEAAFSAPDLPPDDDVASLVLGISWATSVRSGRSTNERCDALLQSRCSLDALSSCRRSAQVSLKFLSSVSSSKVSA